MSLLLGIPDAKIGEKDVTTSLSNKIGGLPDWYDKIASPQCGCCSQPLSLVVQLYCPLHLSLYHRTLYVFGCTRRSCWNRAESWVVYRCQQLEPRKPKPEPVSSDDWGIDADSWGNDADDWGDGADNWGDGSTNGDGGGSDWVGGGSDWGGGADNWGDGQCDLSSNTAECDASQSSDGFQKGETGEHSTEAVGDLDLGAMCIDDIDSELPEQGQGQSTKHILAEDVPQITEEARVERIKQLESDITDSTITRGSVLESYYLNVIEESSEDWEDVGHVKKLLKEYQRTEAVDLKDMLDSASGTGGGGGGSEGYEKTALPHKDVTFHKFSKRLALCPQQCIRYCWSGAPLYISAPKKGEQPSRCRHCGGELVFELQLTPTLVNILRVPATSGPVLEFGTVLVFTCKDSCWLETDKLKTEAVVVQADPDQHLFV